MTNVSIVLYHTLRCPHCVSFYPEFMRAATALKGTPGLNVAAFDVGDEESRKDAEGKLGKPIESVPLAVAYVDGAVVEYSGPRTAAGVEEFARKIMATRRREIRGGKASGTSGASLAGGFGYLRA